MKKISMLLSVFIIFGMLSTLTVFAAGTTDAEITLVPSVTEVKVGETVTVTVGVKGDTSGTLGLYGTPKIQPKWNTEYFEYVSGEVDSSTFALANSTTLGATTIANGYVSFSQKVNQAQGENPVAGDQTFGTITLRALKATDTATNITLNSSTSVFVDSTSGGTAGTRIAVPKNTTVAITIKAAGSTEPTYPTIDTEETFTAGENIGGITATNDTKAISVFAKANKALEANSYGIRVVSGGKTYVFRGIAPVAENGVWAIKVVSPDGTFSFKDGGTLSATSEYITTFED